LQLLRTAYGDAVLSSARLQVAQGIQGRKGER